MDTVVFSEARVLKIDKLLKFCVTWNREYYVVKKKIKNKKSVHQYAKTHPENLNVGKIQRNAFNWTAANTMKSEKNILSENTYK